MNCIFQFFIGNPLGYKNCITSVNDYCKKYEIGHYLSNNRAFKDLHIMFEKYQFIKLAIDNPQIKRILYVDADILVTPHAKNIFEVYADFNGLYAFDENQPTEWMDRDKYIEDTDWPLNDYGKKQYFNAGIMLFDADLLRSMGFSLINKMPDWKNLMYFGDQTPINYNVVKNNIQFKTIDYSFNRMDLGNYDPLNERYKANFIHYAGPCKYGNGNKVETMISDYNFLYKKSL